MRSVTRYPPTTLIVAKITAKVPRITVKVLLPGYPAAIRAPTIVIPEIAFDPDIRGVCNWDGTFDISSNPVNTARTKTKSNNPIDSIIEPLGRL